MLLPFPFCPGGPEWSWFLSPRPQPGRAGFALFGGVLGFGVACVGVGAGVGVADAVGRAVGVGAGAGVAAGVAAGVGAGVAVGVGAGAGVAGAAGAGVGLGAGVGSGAGFGAGRGAGFGAGAGAGAGEAAGDWRGGADVVGVRTGAAATVPRGRAPAGGRGLVERRTGVLRGSGAVVSGT